MTDDTKEQEHPVTATDLDDLVGSFGEVDALVKGNLKSFKLSKIDKKNVSLAAKGGTIAIQAARPFLESSIRDAVKKGIAAERRTWSEEIKQAVNEGIQEAQGR